MNKNITNVLEELHNNLEQLTEKSKELEKKKIDLLRENKTATAALKGMNKAVGQTEGSKQTIRELEKSAEQVAIETKQKLKEINQELKKTYVQIKAVEFGIIEGQLALEFVDDI
jgi:methyl-accepting chemotaxis protein